MSYVPSPVSLLGNYTEQQVDLLLGPVFANPELSYFFNVLDIRVDRSAAMLGEIGRALRTDAGCGVIPTSTIPISKVDMNVADLDARFTLCWNEVQNTGLAVQLRGGIEKWTIEQLQFFDATVLKVRNAIYDNAWQVLWFGNDASGNTSINMFDGVWITALATPANKAYNLGPTLTADEGIAALDAMFDARPRNLRGVARDEFKVPVTTSVFRNIVNSLGSTCCTELAFQNAVNGFPGTGVYQTLTYAGYTVVEMPMWDDVIYELGLGNPHRALLFHTPTNYALTDLTNEDSNFIGQYYDRNTRETVIEGAVRLGFANAPQYPLIYAS